MPDATDAETVLRRFLEEMWNKHDLASFATHVHADARLHPPRGRARDHAQYRHMAEEFLKGFPDLRFTIADITGAGDRASARLIIEGTNTGPYRGRAPTGRRVRVVGQPQCRVQDGKIIEFWQLFDELGMMHQLGHVSDATLLGHDGAALPP